MSAGPVLVPRMYSSARGYGRILSAGVTGAEGDQQGCCRNGQQTVCLDVGGKDFHFAEPLYEVEQWPVCVAFEPDGERSSGVSPADSPVLLHHVLYSDDYRQWW